MGDYCLCMSSVTVGWIPSLIVLALVTFAIFITSPLITSFLLRSLHNLIPNKWRRESKSSNQILVHAYSTFSDAATYGHTVGYDTYGKFFTLDLDTGEVSDANPRSKTLLDEFGSATMVALGSTVYLIGGERSYKSKGFKYHNKIDEEKNKHVHKGASYLDLTRPEEGWIQAPLMKYDANFPPCVSFDGKIYAFGPAEKTGLFAEVFDPEINRWDSLSLPPVDVGKFRISSPAIADPSNARILVHFRHYKDMVGFVYAYYPADGGSWELLISDFGCWFKPVVLLDGVIYFHVEDDYQMIIFAFDLANKEFLKVVLTSEFKCGLQVGRYKAFLHLGDGVLGLVTYAHDNPFQPRDEIRTYITLVKFRVQRSTTNPQELLATRLSVDRFNLNTYCNVVTALAL